MLRDDEGRNLERDEEFKDDVMIPELNLTFTSEGEQGTEEIHCKPVNSGGEGYEENPSTRRKSSPVIRSCQKIK